MILVIYGTRPEYIKLYPLILAFKKAEIEHLFLCTNQHQNLVEDIEHQIGIFPDIRLSAFEQGQNLASLSSKITTQLQKVFNDNRPNLTIVQGDTVSAFLGAITSFQNQVPVAHLEAGLRTNNLNQPFPEEGYRQMISRITSINFCATNLSEQNLINENISKDSIFITGNTVIDSLRTTLEKLDLDAIPWSEKRHVLVTSHRRENWGKGEENISRAVFELAEAYPDLEFVWPIHPNPILRETIYNIYKEYSVSNVNLAEPLNYLDLVKLLNKTKVVITDSGGLQEEAPSFKIPTLITRETTERPEGVESGFSFLVGANTDKIKDRFKNLIENWQDLYDKLPENPYGDGQASKKIIEIIKEAGYI